MHWRDPNPPRPLPERVRDGQRDNAGLYVAVGRGSADVEHNLLGSTFKAGRTISKPSPSVATGPASARTTGIMTASCRGTWYDMDMTARRGLRNAETSGFGFVTSLEWLSVRPGQRLVDRAAGATRLSDLRIDHFNDGAADVRYSTTDSLAGRTGARVARDWDVEGDPKRKVTLWGRRISGTSFSATRRLSSRRPPALSPSPPPWAIYGASSTSARHLIADATSLYGNVNYETGFNGNANSWEAKVGSKVRW